MAANNSGFLYNKNSSGGGGAMSNSSSGSGGGYHDRLINPVGRNYYHSPAPGGILNDGAAVILDNNSLLDSGLKHDTGLAVEWSVDEQYKLEQGLAKYANEPNMMRYIKVAASLQDKTVRDVALRCRWMTRKRRKPGDQSLGKKVKDRKDKLIESTLQNTTSSASSVHVPAYSLTTNHHRPSDYMLSGVLSCTARHLLEENNQAFGQISANLSTLKPLSICRMGDDPLNTILVLKGERHTRHEGPQSLGAGQARAFPWRGTLLSKNHLQENIDLFSRTRNNIAAILNSMRNMPGIMSQMPPLPVLLNEDLANSIFPHSSQPIMFGLSSLIPLKREPGC